jgi:RNA polymerase sigma-B factor
MALAEALAERWTHRSDDRLDLRQVAYLGLVQAAKRFDCSKSSAFAAFAASHIRGELHHYVRDRSRVLRLPRALVAAAASDPSRSRALAAPLSLDATVTVDGREVSFSEAIGEVDGRLALVEERVPLLHALRSLPEPARLVVHLRYFEDLTQAEIARRTGSTQKAVSRTLDASLRSLRRKLSENRPAREARGRATR